MSQAPQPSPEYSLTGRQIILGLVTIFTVNFTMSFFIQTLVIARPRMAAELNGMSLYSWSISIPGLAAAFATLIFSKFSDMYGRRIMLLISVVLFLIGTVLSAVSPTFEILIAANTIARLGNGALAPICFSFLGDMFEPVKRSRWVGLLRIPGGIFAVFGPTLGGWFVDNMSWRHIYWMGVPLLILCLVLIPFGVPRPAKRVDCKIDVRGALLVAVASSTTILGLSFAGSTYPWGSVQVIGLLGFSLVFWVLFFHAEHGAEEPIMDPQVFRDRTFLTIAISGLMSFFGLMAMTMYYPIFLQAIKGISVMRSGQIMTPLSVFMAFMGVPAGFILAKTKRYKWMLIVSYGTLTAVISGIVFFTAETSLLVALGAATLAGLGLGAIPTINTLVVQYAVPKRMLGASMGAIFFSITMGMAISPAVLGSAMNVAYSRSLEASLPAELHRFADEQTIVSLGDPKSLLAPKAMQTLRETFNNRGEEGQALFEKTVKAIRVSMEAGLQSVFLIGAVTMLLSFLLILTVPEISMHAVVQDRKFPGSASAPKEPVGITAK